MTQIKKYKEKFDIILLFLILISSVLLIYSLVYIFNYYSSNDLLVHYPQSVNSDLEKLNPNEIGDSIGGTLNPIIAFTASILTFLAFYIQYRANKSQRDIFNLSLENEVTKLQNDAADKRNEIAQFHNSNLKVFKTLIVSMIGYYENTGKELKSFILTEELSPLKMNTFSFLTNASYKYFNQIEFKQIYNSILVYFNGKNADFNWEEEFIEALNYINYYESMIIELREKFQLHVEKKYTNMITLGEQLNKQMGIVFTDEFLSINKALVPYMEIVHNRKQDNTLVMPEEEFYKIGTDFERLHKEFFPNFIFQVKARFEMTKDEKYFILLEDLSTINKGLGTEIYQSKNYVDSLKTRFSNYFDFTNEKYPILRIKEFISNIEVD